MNGPNRPLPYRRSRRRRQRLRNILILSGVALVVLIIVFLIIGNALKDKVNENKPSKDSEQTDSDRNEPVRTTPKAIKASPVLLETNDASTFYSRLSRLQSKGSLAASVPLNTQEGALLYRSEVAIELGLQQIGEHSVSLSQAIQSTETMGMYLSGTFYLTAFSQEDDLVRSVQLAEASAILAEAARAGIDDILLIAPDLTEEQISEFLQWIDGIRSLAPDAVLGLALPDALVSEEQSATIMNTLDQALNFLALDATEYADADPATYVDEILNGEQYRYYWRRYQMRILIPEQEEEAIQQQIIEAIERNKIDNWQILSDQT